VIQYSDETEKFAKLELKDQIKIMYSMLHYVRGQLPIIQKEQVDFRDELRHVRQRREAEEMNTAQKIETILSKRFDFWIYFRDKVLPNIITVATLALLYLIFQKP
jgi:hypothetical protein